MKLNTRGLWAVGWMLGVGTTGCFDDDTRNPPLTTDGAVTDVQTADVVTADTVTVDTPAADVAADAVTSQDAAADAPAAAPTVRVTAPASGAQFAVGFPQRIVVAATNFVLQPYTGTTMNTPGRGHFHVYLDANDNGDYLNAEYNTGPLVTIPAGTSVGMHTLRVSLRNNDHSALSTPVDTTLPIMVVNSTAPMVVVDSPADNAAARVGMPLAMQIRVANFMLRPFATQTGTTPNVGHYHVYLDANTGGNYLIADSTTTPMVTIPTGTAPGPHTLNVSLRYDDHSEVGAMSSATLHINVAP